MVRREGRVDMTDFYTCDEAKDLVEILQVTW